MKSGNSNKSAILTALEGASLSAWKNFATVECALRCIRNAGSIHFEAKLMADRHLKGKYFKVN